MLSVQRIYLLIRHQMGHLASLELSLDPAEWDAAFPPKWRWAMENARKCHGRSPWVKEQARLLMIEMERDVIARLKKRLTE